MSPSKNALPRQPVIVKTVEPKKSGIHSFEYTRCAIGYVLSGHKHIYSGDMMQEANAGDLFFLSQGSHFIEEIPDGRKPFEQVIFFYTPQQMGHIVSQLRFNHNTDVRVRHSCNNCYRKEQVVSRGWGTMQLFFEGVDRQLRDGLFMRDHTAEMLKLTELVYHVVSGSEGCLRSRILGSTDPEKELLERTVYDYVFSDITLAEMAERNNRSLTAFKKAFKGHFQETPHRWVVRQRLLHASLLLISTNKPVMQIIDECHFTSMSHFIRLFQKEFGTTPKKYRLNNNYMFRIGKLSDELDKIIEDVPETKFEEVSVIEFEEVEA
jgi:AraC-like DNA-binding protein